MMKTIIISEGCHRNFLNYIEKNHKYCYEQIKCFSVYDVDEKSTLIPHESQFSINYKTENGDDGSNVNTFDVSITHDNDKPLYNGLNLGYLLRITVSYTDLNILKEFVDIASASPDIIVCANIQMYHSKSRGFWEKAAKIYGQSFENIFLPQEIKNSLLNHIDSFNKNKERYLKFGRIYKLCFLLTGVPGSGKSSLIKAVAMKYNRPIYVITLSKKLDDDALADLFSDVKENSIIVLEDIDAFFIDRHAQDINISFSAILNMFDGLFSPGNGCILFMTGNNPERLDSALIRPGRVDQIIKFDYPKKKEVQKAFNAIVSDDPENFANFYKNISGTQISMAGIVDYLFRHPTDYLDCISELNTHTQLLHEITDKSSKLYT